MSEVKLRFAPSPTGYLHIGGLRTALFNYLYARHHGGKFILRIEDTDRTRFVEGALENLLHVLEWAGIENDEGPQLLSGDAVAGKDGTDANAAKPASPDYPGVTESGEHGPYIQSTRQAEGLYNKYAEQLIDEGKAYYCFCTQERLDWVREEQKARGETPRYDGFCRNILLEEARARVAAGEPHVVRLKLPENTDITFHDAIKGDITFNTADLDDQVLIKTDGFPTYHFAVVVDDHLMGVTHIVRGEEWISSTPKHVLLYRDFGWEQPEYVHLPTVLGEDHKKLSKRNGDAAVEQYIEKGYLPEALINYIALLGWSPKSNQEVMDKDELIAAFDFDRISSNGGIFDIKKLNWMNQEYIKKMPVEEAEKHIRRFLTEAGLIGPDYDAEKLRLVTETYQSRIEYFAQVPDMTRHLFVAAADLHFDDDAREALQAEGARALVENFEARLKAQDLTPDFANGVVKEIQKETGVKGKNLWFPIRAAVVGATSGPDFGNTLRILGKDEVLARIDRVRREIWG